MRRWLAVFLLLLLPLQFSWAAVASYCAHEGDAGGGHFGHHDHGGHGHGIAGLADEAVDDEAVTDEGEAGAASSAEADIDCGHCHGHCAGIVQIVPGSEAQASASAPPVSADGPRVEHMPAAPERPQWACLA